MEDVDWSFYLLKSCYLIHKIGRTIAEEPCIVAELLVFLSLCLLECVQLESCTHSLVLQSQFIYSVRTLSAATTVQISAFFSLE